MHSSVHGIGAFRAHTKPAAAVDTRFISVLGHHLGVRIRMIGEPLPVDDTHVIELKAGNVSLWCRQYRNGVTEVSSGDAPLAEIRMEKDGAVFLRTAEAVSHYTPEGVIERIEYAGGRVEYYDGEGNLSGSEDPAARQSVMHNRRKPLVKIRPPRPKKRRVRIAIVPLQLGAKPPSELLSKKPLVDPETIASTGREASAVRAVEGVITAAAVGMPKADIASGDARITLSRGAACFLDYALWFVWADKRQGPVQESGTRELGVGGQMSSADHRPTSAAVYDAECVIASALLCAIPVIIPMMNDSSVGPRETAGKGSARCDAPVGVMPTLRAFGVSAGKTAAASAFRMLETPSLSDNRARIMRHRAATVLVLRTTTRPAIRPPIGAGIFAPFASGPHACILSEADAVRVRQPLFPTIPTAPQPVVRREEVREPELIARADFEKTDGEPDDERERHSQGDDGDQSEDEERFV